MFVGLIDTRPRWEPEPQPEKRRRRLPEIPWRALAVVWVVVALFVAADATDGIVAYGLVLAGVTVGSLAVDRAFTFKPGMKEYRQ